MAGVYIQAQGMVLLAVYYQSTSTAFDLHNLLCALSGMWLYIIWNGEQEVEFQPWLQQLAWSQFN